MARAFPLVNAFTAGELSPRLYGRVDYDRHQNTARKIENLKVYPQGGVRRRGGSVYVAALKSSAAKGRLMPFEFSDQQAYVVQAENLVFRYLTEGAQLISGTPVETVTPYLTAQLFDLQHAQVADVMTITHPSWCPRELSRTSATAFALGRVAFEDGPYLAENLTSALAASTATLTFGATSGSTTCTASSALFAATDTTGTNGTGDMDRHIRVYDGTTWHWAKITAYTSTTVVTVSLQSTLGSVGPHSRWRLGSFSSTTGFPRAVTFFGNRRFFGGTTAQPMTVWGSAVDDYPYFSPSSDDDGSLDMTLAGRKANPIRWLAASSESLFVGTTGQEYEIAAPNGAALTPSNRTAKPQTNKGSAAVVPVEIDNVLAFVSRDGRKVHEISFDYNTETHIAPDLTLISEHVTAGGIVQMDVARTPENEIFAVRNDGEMPCCSFLRNERVLAWRRYIAGGAFSGGQAVIESCCVIPAASGIGYVDQLWWIVKRTVNGSTVRYIEYLDDDRYTDSGLTSAGPASSVSGLTHLEGQEVAVRANGARLPNKTVSSGAISLGGTYSDIEVGLPFTHKLHVVPPDFGAQAGRALGQPKQIWSAVLMLQDSLGSTVNDDPILTRDSNDEMGSGPDTVTDFYAMAVDAGWRRDNVIEIEGDAPLPFGLNAIVFGQNVSEG